MSIQKNTFQELDLCNSFLFAAALEQPEICRLVLEIILGQKVPGVKIHTEHSMLVSADFRSVRFDVYASDELQVAYNVEAQNENEGNLPKRSRYHQAELVHFLKYMEESTDAYVSEITEQSIIQLYERVIELKKWRNLEERFITGEELMRQRERKGRAAGLAEGKAESVLALLEDCGTVPEGLKAQIYGQKDAEVLTRWLKLSAKVSSVDQFVEQM